MMRSWGVRFATPDPPPTPRWVTDRFTGARGLYVHIPFCRSLCPFCPYNKVRYDPDLVGRYGTALLEELRAYLDAGAGPFSSLYVGGGTPTLCLDLVAEVAGRVEVAGERAIEVLPLHLTVPGADRLTGLGFDAVSIGVQSFDPGALRHLRRPTTRQQNLRAVEAAVGRFACVDVDLIFDTAYAHPDVLLADLATCFALGVDQVSTYPLMRFGYTPFGRAAHEPAAEHALLRAATELAAAQGYERRAVWTFNRVGGPTYSSITRPRYLGVGAGAASWTGQAFLVNHFGIGAYLDALATGHLPVARLVQLHPSQAAAYRLFWQLYTGSVPAGFTAGLDGGRRIARALLAGARVAGWLHTAGTDLHLTPIGYDRYHDLERWVTYHLIEPLWAELMAEHVTTDPSAARSARSRSGTGADRASPPLSPASGRSARSASSHPSCASGRPSPSRSRRTPA